MGKIRKQLLMLMLAAAFALLLFIPETAQAAGSKQSIKASVSKTKLYRGEFTKIKVKATGISSPKYKFTSSKPDILAVDANGIVQAVGVVSESTKVKVTIKETKTGKTTSKTFTVKPFNTGKTIYDLYTDNRCDVNSDNYTEVVRIDRFNNTHFAVQDSNAFYLHVGDKSFQLYYNDDCELEDWQFGGLTVYGINNRYFAVEIAIWGEGDLPDCYVRVFDYYLENRVTSAYRHAPGVLYGKKGSETLVFCEDDDFMEYIGIHRVFLEGKLDAPAKKFELADICNVIQVGDNLKMNYSCNAYKSSELTTKAFTLNKGDSVHIYKLDFANDSMYVANSKGELGWVKIDRKDMISGVLTDAYEYYFGDN